ncbi:hypothetical protein BXY85_0050 [Roseivirga pacifica]|uniref:Uncharacterized protein n=1 Tax=Roseivirga pacifica TaxID=1267423 RepID=A0A1I0R5F9_9BACT|nr:hypothetical protein [Roseivirga pacifica]RKQ49063.1 hypothetical protein BXY85_0050 [Roseivirga pacifica]SEW35794.1 hypothetical protein SAMN05216290_3103 [Roseivirga pacifica]
MRTLFFLALILLVGCSNTRESYELSFFVKSQLPQISNKEVIIAIPNAGCKGCITNTENFVLNNFRNPKLGIFFFNVNSNKLLKLRLGDVLFSDNVIVQELG